MRIREVYPTDQIAHMWAHQHDSPQPVHYARNPQGNFYYDRETIYSYGTHFPIARLRTTKYRPEPYVLLTTREYSNTTAGHKSAVRSACSHLKVFYVHDVSRPEITFEEKRKKIRSLKVQYKSARSYVAAFGMLQEIKQLVHDVNLWRDYMHLPGRLQVPKEVELKIAELTPKMEERAGKLKDAQTARDAARQERWRKQREQWDAQQKADAEKKAKEKAEFATKIGAWEAGEIHSNQLPGRYDNPPRMRLVRGHSAHPMVQTTLGAIAPLDEVRKIWDVVKDAITKQQGWVYPYRSGPSVGGFQVSNIGPDGSLIVGCHHFEAAAVLSFAQRMGWYTPPSLADGAGQVGVVNVPGEGAGELGLQPDLHAQVRHDGFAE